jgi:hypothetical protein
MLIYLGDFRVSLGRRPFHSPRSIYKDLSAIMLNPKIASVVPDFYENHIAIYYTFFEIISYSTVNNS